MQQNNLKGEATAVKSFRNGCKGWANPMNQEKFI